MRVKLWFLTQRATKTTKTNKETHVKDCCLKLLYWICMKSSRIRDGVMLGTAAQAAARHVKLISVGAVIMIIIVRWPYGVVNQIT